MNKKRIMSLLLAMLMLTSVLFTGCDAFGGEDEDVEGEVGATQAATAETLSMYVVSEKPVDEKTAKLVQDAFNKITKVEFKTQVILHFHTYDEYYDVIEDKVQKNFEHEELKKEADRVLKAAKKAARAEGVVTDDAWFDAFYEQYPQFAEFRETEELTGDDTTAEQTEQVTVEDMDGNYTISQLKYPDEKPFQIDILWIDSYSRYLDYIKREMITEIDSELTGSSKKLTEYINGELLTWSKWVTGSTYAVPNNSVLGEYTYLMVNKELAKKYSYDPTTLTSLEKCSDFLADVAKYETGVAPILGELQPVNNYYWNIDLETGMIDSSTFSMLGSTTLNRTHDPALKTENVILSCNNIFKDPDFLSQIRCIQKYKDAGYIVAEDENPGNYAVRVIKGDAILNSVYGEEYELNVLEYPRVGYEDIFSSMYAVSSYTRDVARSMQIITYLNTNRNLRNVLQYGVEGVHYKIDDESGRLVRLNQDYMMDINKTGNVFLAYPEEDMPLDIWEWGKKQNLDAKPYLSMGFDFSDRLEVPEGEDEEYTILKLEEIQKINDLSKDIYEQLNNIESLEQLEIKIKEWANLEENKDYSYLKTQKSAAEASEKNPIPGMYYYYFQWVQDKGLYKVEAE